MIQEKYCLILPNTVYVMSMKPEWQLTSPDPEIVKALVADLNCHPVTATLLANRSLFSKQEAMAFFSPSLSNIRHPFEIKDMKKAVDRLIYAIEKEERVLVFGDYDADGITSTVILVEFLNRIGASVVFYVPHRVNEGYGLKAHHISKVAVPQKANLMITVDCGSDSHDAVTRANEAGIDVIITDHHAISPQLPPAMAIINPKRQDCPSGLDHLAGVGVVFYLLMALRKSLRERGFFQDQPEPNLKDYCDMVALGTVADIVPMIDENRAFTRVGLEIMSKRNRVGLNALMDSANINCEALDTEDIAFRLAPRLNAAGRIGNATTSISLLTADAPETAFEITDVLNQYNVQRKHIENETLKDILFFIKQHPDLLNQKSLVLHNKNWHEGILGIVASRLVKKYTKPVILVASQNGVGRGSARSIPGFNLYEGLQRCESLLEGYGGHAMAAGLSIKTECLPDFVSQFETAVCDLTQPEDFVSQVVIDGEIPFGLITDKLLTELEFFKPFGKDNPEPLFVSHDIKVAQSHVLGQYHRRMVLKQEGDGSRSVFSAIQFNIDPTAPKPTHFDHILYRLRYNHWNGKKSIQLVIEDA